MARILSADHKGLRGKAEAVRKAMEEPHLPAESSGLGLLISSQWPWWGGGKEATSSQLPGGRCQRTTQLELCTAGRFLPFQGP